MGGGGNELPKLLEIRTQTKYYNSTTQKNLENKETHKMTENSTAQNNQRKKGINKTYYSYKSINAGGKAVSLIRA